MRTIVKQQMSPNQEAAAPTRARRFAGRVRCGAGQRQAAATARPLPKVWAVAETSPQPQRKGFCRTRRVPVEAAPPAPRRDLSLYRPYTEALLRRYVKLAMECGRAPSLLGREMFRGHVTHYKVQGFNDVVIFCHDIERVVRRLQAGERAFVERIAMQEYSQGETASLLRMSLRTVVRGYAEALDQVTELLLEARLLEPLKSCQGGQNVKFDVSPSNESE